MIRYVSFSLLERYVPLHVSKNIEAGFYFHIIHLCQVLHRLEGHSKRVTTLAFSSTSNILISGDANGQVSI